MSIESEKKRLNDFLAKQTAVFEENKKRAVEQARNTIVTADHAIETLKAHVNRQIASQEAEPGRQQGHGVMRAPDAKRSRQYRRRKRFGLRRVSIDVSKEGVELLAKRGYLLSRTDTAAIGAAVTALLSDLVLEAA